MPLKLLHTGDVHLGAKFLGLGHRGADQRRRLLDTFGDTVELALSENVDVLLIAGDLFDSNKVGGNLVARAASALERATAAGIQVCISPGTHDPFGEASVYAAPPLSSLDGLTVFTGERLEAMVFPELDCTVYGNANAVPFENKHPLSGFRPEGGTRWNIGMAHASFEVPDVTEDTYVVTASEVERCGLDYLALGHYHSLSDRSAGSVTAYYCGSPEMVRMQKGDFGYVLLVEVESEVEVRPVEVCRHPYRELTLRAEEITSAADVVATLEPLAGADRIMRVSVEGLRKVSSPDIEAALEELADSFFYLSFTDRSSPAPTSLDPENYPERSPAWYYLRALQSRLEGARPSEEEVILEAMQAGVSLLAEVPRDAGRET